MKRLLKKIARPIWRMSAPLRRPLLRKFDHHMVQILRPLAPPPAPSPPPASPPPPGVPADLELVLNSVVRELVRLQDQVELLRQQVDDLQESDRDVARRESRLALVGEIG
jgi:hypothetical protein